MYTIEERRLISVQLQSNFSPTSTYYSPAYPTIHLKYNNKKEEGKTTEIDVLLKSDLLDIKPVQSRTKTGLSTRVGMQITTR
jgi:hypothetical protein